MDADRDLTVDALQAFAHSFGVAPEAALEQADTLTLDNVRDFLIEKITNCSTATPPC